MIGCFIFLISMTIWSAPEIKVLIAKDLKKVHISALDLKQYIPAHKKTNTYKGQKSISFVCDPRFSQKDFPKKPLLVTSLSSASGIISWDKNHYLGELQLLTSQKKDSCDLVNAVPMEHYLSSLLAKEMNAVWPIEVLKAQAVAARTYALNKIETSKNTFVDSSQLYHLESSEKDQVSGTFFDSTPKTYQAAEETKGEVLVPPSGKIRPVYYHSKCGGHTLRPDQVWSHFEEGYVQKECPYCHKLGKERWHKRVNTGIWKSMVNKVLKRYYADELKKKDFLIISDDVRKSELKFYDGDRLLSVKKSYLRNLNGREFFPSNNFKVQMNNSQIKIEGEGYGHGVGMCQLGALELAQRGYNYRQILTHYFPKHKIIKAY